MPVGLSELYKLGKAIGEGAFGFVRVAQQRLSRELIAVKTFEKVRLRDNSSRRRLENEIRVLQRIRHPYIVRLYEGKRRRIQPPGGSPSASSFTHQHRILEPLSACASLRNPKSLITPPHRSSLPPSRALPVCSPSQSSSRPSASTSAWSTFPTERSIAI